MDWDSSTERKTVTEGRATTSLAMKVYDYQWATAFGMDAESAASELVRDGIDVLGPHTPAAARLENIARFVDFVSESIARAADQAREILHTRSGTTSDGQGSPR